MTTEQISSSTLWKATTGAIIVGLVLLVTAILPAEYNLDPTGVGKALGLTELSPESLAEKKAAADDAKAGSNSDSAGEAVELTIPPKAGLEYKMVMIEGNQVDFEWFTNGGAVYVDMHGEPKGDTTGYFKSYTITTVNEMKGSFIAPFEGSHGWYFRNDTDQAIDIMLFFSGEYQNPHLL
ncbi:hypothetical protein ACFQ45_09690 [Rhodanobacter aciditrophus]|uniref:Transmembrane anchor protein n=1 Tax=Rhodanobacter aciditrophus TaxID=1623218 RepID=A0ABW4B1D5_9GAMM